MHNLMSTEHAYAYDWYLAYHFTEAADTSNLSKDLSESRLRDLYETTHQVYKITINDECMRRCRVSVQTETDPSPLPHVFLQCLFNKRQIQGQEL